MPKSSLTFKALPDQDPSHPALHPLGCSNPRPLAGLQWSRQSPASWHCISFPFCWGHASSDFSSGSLPHLFLMSVKCHLIRQPCLCHPCQAAAFPPPFHNSYALPPSVRFFLPSSFSPQDTGQCLPCDTLTQLWSGVMDSSSPEMSFM